MKLMSGGWIWTLPSETEFVEIINGAEHERVGVRLYDPKGERIKTPAADVVPDPAHWTQRVAA
jgi:hypothetical protein